MVSSELLTINLTLKYLGDTVHSVHKYMCVEEIVCSMQAVVKLVESIDYVLFWWIIKNGKSKEYSILNNTKRII